MTTQRPEDDVPRPDSDGGERQDIEEEGSDERLSDEAQRKIDEQRKSDGVEEGETNGR